MKKDKVLNQEPAWKRRRVEQRKEHRKANLWLAVVIAIIAVALGGMIYGGIVGVARIAKEKREAKPSETIAKVQDKVVSSKEGGSEYVVTFHLYGQDAKKTVSQKDYDALKEGQEVKVSFKGDPRTDKLSIVSWEPIKLAH